MLARTALSAAVTVALVSVPATISVPAFGSVAESGISVPGTTAVIPIPTATPTDEPSTSPEPSGPPDDDQSDEPQNDPEGDESPGPQDDESALPEGSFDVRKPSVRDTFALYDGSGELFDAEDEDFDHSAIHIPLPDRQGEERDFVLTDRRAALELITADHPEGERYSPNANGEGDRTFTFDVAGDGTIGEISETTPGEPEESESPEPDPPPTTDPTPDPTPTPTDDPEPTDEPSSQPPPTDDPDDGDDRGDEGDDDGSNDGDGSGDDGSGSDDEDSDDESSSDDDQGDDILEDPSTGNGSDHGDRDDPRETAPSGNDDWVPTGPQRPDYSDPVPQPPGANEDDAITPDGEAPTQPAGGEYGDDGASDDVATDSAADGDGSGGMPWQIGVVVAIGAAAIGFILFVAGRRRKD